MSFIASAVPAVNLCMVWPYVFHLIAEVFTFFFFPFSGGGSFGNYCNFKKGEGVIELSSMKNSHSENLAPLLSSC